MPQTTKPLTLDDLPAPPPGKVGWPWTKQSDPVGDRMSDGSEWPRISIVTPSYNQGKFIEETIRSVLLQGYPNLEYIIIDGGSLDKSVEVIRKYEPWLTHWVSEPDKGQTDAIQKGFSHTTGVVWNWLNSDDLLEPNALIIVAKAYQRNSMATVFNGILTVFSTTTAFQRSLGFRSLTELICVWENWNVPQPSIFLSSHACRVIGGLNPSLQYAMDYDLCLRLAKLQNFQAEALERPIARIRRHPAAKTVSCTLLCKQEILMVFDAFALAYPTLMPPGWEKSRSRFLYHLTLDKEKNQLSLSTFLRNSYPFLKVIWNYRFFWAMLFFYFRSKLKFSASSS